MKLRNLLLITVAMCTAICTYAQKESGVKFGKVSPEDFSLSKITVDTSNGAVVIADIGKSYFEGNSKGWFTLVFEHKTRILIVDKKGFDAATYSILLYKSKNSDDEEKLESLKATTYNLENGSVVETKLDKDQVFKEALNDNYSKRKFTMPAVKEGSIIEFSYIIRSDYLFNLQPWNFQGEFPKMWSQYEVTIPSFFKYVFLNQGYFPFYINETTERQSRFTVREQNNAAFARDDVYDLNATSKVVKWVVRNIPSMKPESFTSSIQNHLSKIEFQLAGYDFPNTPYRPYMGSWESVSSELLKSENFGASFTAMNNWLDKDDSKDLFNKPDQLEKAKSIYDFVRTNFKNKGTYGIYLSQPLKQTFKNRNGYAQDINMLLTLLLVNNGFEASPVILSTRDHGYANQFYPLLSKFNYVICKLNLNNKTYYLDASQSYFGFNHLPSYCYNGVARTIGPGSRYEFLPSDSLQESKFTTLTLNLDPKDPKSWKGTLFSTLGYDESSNLRESINEKGKEQAIKKIEDSYSGEFKADKVEFMDVESTDQPMRLKYDLSIENSNNPAFIYFSPMMKEGMRENVFKSAERQYPVEMPYRSSETFVLNIQIPEGYAIEELPKSAKVTFNDNEAYFEYLVSKSEKDIELKTSLRFDKTNFTKEDYESLRGFFDYIVKKHAEQIVFKKK